MTKATEGIEATMEASGAWLVGQTMGAPLATSFGNRVALRIDSRANKSDVTMEQVYVFEQQALVQTLAGLISCGQVAFGREEMIKAMAEYLL